MAQRTARYFNWMVTCFDLDNFAVPDRHPNFQYMVYQVESAPTTGTWHIQGYIELKRQTDKSSVQSMFTCPVHLERRRGTQLEAIAYCMKAETRVADPLEFGQRKTQGGQRTDLEDARQRILLHTSWQAVLMDPDLVNTVSRHMNWAREVFNNRNLVIPTPDIQLRKWEKKVLTILEGPPVKRQVIWIWSYQSGTGKTTFFDYCSAKYTVLPGTDWANTLYLYNGEGIIWFDRTRSESNDDKSVSIFYRDLERWSNHSVHTSTKYQPVRKLVAAHVVVTANGKPDEHLLPNRCLVVEAKHALEESDDEVEEMDTTVPDEVNEEMNSEEL